MSARTSFFIKTRFLLDCLYRIPGNHIQTQERTLTTTLSNIPEVGSNHLRCKKLVPPISTCKPLTGSGSEIQLPLDIYTHPKRNKQY